MRSLLQAEYALGLAPPDLQEHRLRRVQRCDCDVPSLPYALTQRSRDRYVRVQGWRRGIERSLPRGWREEASRVLRGVSGIQTQAHKQAAKPTAQSGKVKSR